MQTSKYLQKIFTKEMTRKEFLVYLGMFFVTISGVSTLLKSLSNLNPKPKKTISSNNSSAFGTRAYGV